MTQPSDAISHALLAQAAALWDAGKPGAALPLYEQALAALLPEEPAAHHLEVRRAHALCLCEVKGAAEALALYPGLHQLCMDRGLDDTEVLRQWAKAQEQTGDFAAARKTYERAAPHDLTPPVDRLKWHHALGVLNWRDARLSEERENLRTATELMPTDAREASKLLAVLGNDALLSLELEDTGRALRLADQMQDIGQAGCAIPLSSQINLVRVRAALARRRGDTAAEVSVLKEGLALLERQAREDWMRRLDLTNDYVEAVLRTTSPGAAMRDLADLCDEAPDAVSWIGRFMLARVQIKAGEAAAATSNLKVVIAAFVGGGAPEGELEIVMALSALCALLENRAAARFLGKLALKYLAQVAHSFEGEEQRRVVAAGEEVSRQTAQHLRAAGRYEEALAIQELLARIRRRALVLRARPAGGVAHDPVPFDQAERAAQALWLQHRQALSRLRAGGDAQALTEFVAHMLDRLLRFKNPLGLDRRPANLARPSGQNLRISLVPEGQTCVVHYLWSDRAQAQRIDCPAAVFFGLVAELREAVSDHDAWRPCAAVLYRHLIAPIQDSLAQIACLEVDASGVLGRIPFGLLSDGGPCMIQQVAVKYMLNAAPLPVAAEPNVPDPNAPEPRQGLLHCAGFATGPLAGGLSFMKPASQAMAPARALSAKGFTRAGLIAALAARPAYLSIAAHLDSEPARPEHWALELGSGAPLYLPDFASNQFDLQGLRIALLASCSSGLDDLTVDRHSSLAALALDKGAACFVGTLWDITEDAAAEFVGAFWSALCTDMRQDPARLVADLQSGQALAAQRPRQAQSAAGGIGAQPAVPVPADWAAFAVFENGNSPQQGDH